MKKSPEIAQILKLIEEKERFLITSHKDPDGDSIGSQLGLYCILKNLGKKVIIVDQGNMPERYFFLDPQKIISFADSPLPFEPEVVFVLECPSLDRIGFVQNLIPASAAKINIDHHQDNKIYGDINYIDADSCAAGELIYFIIDEGKFAITPEIAQNLYAAMICDTGNFRFASTTARGMKIAANLIEHGAKPKWIFDHIFSKMSPATLRLLGYTLGSLNVTGEGRISYLTVTQENVKRAGARIEDSEGFVDYSLAVAGVSMGILFKEVSNSEIKISIRSQNGFDSARFAKRFDGGGHINAAGFTMNGNLQEVIENVLQKAAEYVSGK
jgi:bifunctional oligoribonuclease and PAP phosphatase NrnA